MKKKITEKIECDSAELTTQRQSFVFYASFLEAIQAMPRKYQAPMFVAIAEYAIYGKLPDLKGISEAIFNMVKPMIDKNNSRYANKANRTSSADNNTQKATARSRKNATTATNDSASKSKQAETTTRHSAYNINDNDNVNDNDNANDNVKGEREMIMLSDDSLSRDDVEPTFEGSKSDDVDTDRLIAIERQFYDMYIDQCYGQCGQQLIKELRRDNPMTCQVADVVDLAAEVMEQFIRQRHWHNSFNDFANHIENVIRIKNRDYTNKHNRNRHDNQQDNEDVFTRVLRQLD